MWILMFFQLMNNNVTHYQLGQYLTEKECAQGLTKATVLVTTSNIALYCFEVDDG